ncbi:MAG TPA: cysteine peptidase family C39 domain-containing protein [Ktedonobacteraceae bacterium]|nr:cysteine peptidase family C39 domain-containing protein [Ktedonobacteraceae bacterium]
MKQGLLVTLAGMGMIGFCTVMLLAGFAFRSANQNAQANGCTSSTDATSTIPGTCFPSSPYAAQVVQWAAAMANALYVNPACGRVRSYPNCYDTWYTSAFPQAVIAYGQRWCQVHHDCADWANGTYQCVSFVRGAYSQVYPMPLSNNAFALWSTYRDQPGWQEIPAAAVADAAQRGIPEPGDVMIFKDEGVGHTAIIMSVQPPLDGHAGWVTFANANSSSAYDRMPLLPNLLVDTSEWQGDYSVWGYIRPLVVTQQDASGRLERISQLDPAQYASASEYNTWASSACSAAAMTEVLDAYGFHLRIHDVLQVEIALGYITPPEGLTADQGIAATMQHFGFTTTWGEHWTLAQVESRANAGTPVIVSWPPDRYPGGHLVVVLGGNNATVEIADSSSWDRHILSVAQFMLWWGGFAAVSVPSA